MKSILKLLLLIFLFKCANSNAQISIAPTAIFIDKNSGVGNLYVSNKSDKSQEITVSFAFGYPSSDEDGNLVMNYGDSSAFQIHALDPVVRAFPRTFVLAPNKQQTVRIQVKSGTKLKDGFYFTRIKVLSTQQSAEVTDKPVEGISSSISFKFEQVTAAFYKKGPLKTGLKIENVDSEQKDGKLIVKTHLDRLGNAPFLGSVSGKLLDSTGKVVSEVEATTTVYFKSIRRTEFDVANLPPGKYQLELTYKSQRSDMTQNDLVQTEPVTYTSSVSLK